MHKNGKPVIIKIYKYANNISLEEPHDCSRYVHKVTIDMDTVSAQFLLYWKFESIRTTRNEIAREMMSPRKWYSLTEMRRRTLKWDFYGLSQCIILQKKNNDDNEAEMNACNLCRKVKDFRLKWMPPTSIN